jgi:mutator protein MutT
MSTRTRVVAAVITRGDRLLVCQRPLHKRYGGLWEFPGGKCEPDESIGAAVQRELREELSVQVIKVGHEEIALADPDSSYQIIFLPVHISGEPVCNEHIALRWATPSELKHVPLAPSDRQYLNFRLAKKIVLW